jgi:hypothetical protein
MSDNPERDYNENYRENLPQGVTYSEFLANYFYKGKRFFSVWTVEQYRKYLFSVTTGLSVWFLITNIWDNSGSWLDRVPWNSP